MMKSAVFLSLALIVAAAGAGTKANAATYNFDVNSLEGDFSFQIAQHSVPGNVAGDDSYGILIVRDIPSFTNGKSYQTYYQFYNAGAGGGFDDGLFHSFAADQLFTGTIADPIFKLGTFALSDYYSGALLGSLTIAPFVLEPSTWVMMILGMGVMGFAVRARRKVPDRLSFAT